MLLLPVIAGGLANAHLPADLRNGHALVVHRCRRGPGRYSTHPRRRVPHFAPCAYAQRHHIEQTVSKLKQHRHLATRYDKLDASFEDFLCARIATLYLN
ncbi:hypothetical protein E5J99_20800 [Hymenobacter elongatus]|uniref:Uncharacterized protein n=1 Tax=Hymenobacter elongatus TaxID=877208 RepID=A0A4Z0PE45_9BACT|nr:hypothetical protein E5J99_20800 [Hymenobacter elongatus]